MGFDLVAASLRADAADEKTFLEVLAQKMQEALPGGVEVRREGGLFRKEHPVAEIVLTLGDWIFRLERSRGGRLIAERSHVVRGVVLSSERVDTDEWIASLTHALVESSQHSGVAAEALRRFLT